jgi:hypothetical protein
MQLMFHKNKEESDNFDTFLDANWIKYKEILNEIKIERTRNFKDQFK